jgi:NACHT domain
VAILVAVSLGLPTLWATWTAYRGPRRAGTTATGLNLGQVADQLAIAVGAQWEAEAAIRRLNDPYPLPVSWKAADASLTDAWDALVKLAASGAGWPPPPETWAADPDELAGQGGEMVEVLARVPTGRLVVLGQPGAGKTMLMVRLMLDLLACRAAGSAVPFLASIASWNPAEQELRGWLAAQFLVDHPALAVRPEGGAEPTQAAALLASGRILPVLDGLDEIPEQVRGRAIGRINDSLRPGEQVVMTCRSQQ